MTGPLCPDCGGTNRRQARFCDSCGARLALAAVDVPAPRADEELKHVTVLFSDVVGSTAIIAGLTPEQARLRLMPAVDVMAEAVDAFGGTLNQSQGDGIMALFGAPVSQEDHALRACCAALRMHELAALLQPETRFRAGLATGLTSLSDGRASAAGAFLAFGATIHLASRLQGLADPGATLCSGETMRMTASSVQAVALGQQAIRGLPAAEDVFQVSAVRRTGLRFHSALARGLNPHVGRAAELAALQACAGAVQTGAGSQVAVLVGDAGIGKSRLVWEFTRSLNLLNWQVYQAEALTYGRTIPYMLVTALLRSCFGVDERSPTLDAADLEARVAALGEMPPLLRAAPLSLLMPSALHGIGWEDVDPSRRRAALRDSIIFLVQALARDRPVLLLAEDLHWADEESLRLLDLVAAANPRLLLLATHRSGFDPGWASEGQMRLLLGPLPAGAMWQLVQSACPSGFDDSIREELLDRAAGNPFFLEEMARAAADAQAATSRVAGGAPAMVPSTVQAVLAARIDRLTASDKQVLTAASALGNRFALATLEALFADRSAVVFQGHLGRLGEAGFLRPDRSTDDGYGFTHALIQEVAYAGLPGGRRRRLHGDIVRAIKSVYADRSADQAERLTYHARLGEAWDEVVVHARIAGRRSASRSAYPDAVGFFQQAVAAYDHLPVSEEALAQRIDLRFELRNALFPTAAIGQTLVHSQEAERLALQLGDQRRLAWATAYHARDLTLAGRPTDALETASRALQIAHGDEEIVVVIRFYIGLADYFRGAFASAAATLRDVLEIVEAGDPMRRYGLPGPCAMYLRAWLAWSLARMGRIAEADDAVAGMRTLAEQFAQPLGPLVTLLSEGLVHAYADRLAEAETALRACLELCHRWELYSWFANISRTFGWVLLRLGATDEAIRMLEQAAERTRASGILVGHANEMAWLAEAQLAAGRTGTALDNATEAIRLAETHEERGNEATARFALGRVLLVLGRDGEGALQFQQAAAIAAECGMPPFPVPSRRDPAGACQQACGFSV